MSSKKSIFGVICDSEHPGRAAFFLQAWGNKNRNDQIKQSEQERSILSGNIWPLWEVVMAER